MSVISEKVRKAIYAKLNVAAVVGSGKATAIYNAKAPESAAFPYVVFNRQGSSPVTYTMGPTLALEDDLWLIKVIADEDSSTSKEPQEIAEDVLNLCESTLGTSLTISGNTVSWLAREYDMPAYEERQGDRYLYHRGFLLRVQAE
jgi:hypothetical protein